MSNHKKKSTKINVRKSRIKGTSKAIIEELKEYNEEDVINKVYIDTRNKSEFIKELSLEIEWYILEAISNPKTFKLKLFKYFNKKSKEIIRQNKIKEYFCFLNYIYELLHQSSISVSNIEIAYLDLLSEMSTYMSRVGMRIAGITTDNKTIIKKEFYPFLDIKLQEIMDLYLKNPTSSLDQMVKKHLKKDGYNIDSFSEIETMIYSERIWINMQMMLVPFINEKNIDFIKEPFMPPKLEYIQIEDNFKNLNKYCDLLHERRRLIPKKGITIKGYNGNIENIHLREVFLNNTVYMIYRVKSLYGYIYGYYNTKTDFFYSMYLDSKQIEASRKHLLLRKYILELYSILTTDIKSDITLVEIKKDSIKNKTKSCVVNRHKLTNCVTDVDFYIRKLPMDSYASDTAIELAEKYGIKLGIGETFVRPFKKNVKKISEK